MIEDRLKALLVAGMAGDEASYRRFLHELAVFLRGFLRRRLASRVDEVEDVLQETLLAVHNQRATYDAAQPVTAWLHAIARYKLVDYLRRHGRREAHNVSLDDEMELFAADEREARDAQRDLAQLLDTLPDKQRRPIVHVKLEGRSVSETAMLTGMSESAVKVAVHRGLKALAARLRSTA